MDPRYNGNAFGGGGAPGGASGLGGSGGGVTGVNSEESSNAVQLQGEGQLRATQAVQSTTKPVVQPLGQMVEQPETPQVQIPMPSIRPQVMDIVKPVAPRPVAPKPVTPVVPKPVTPAPMVGLVESTRPVEPVRAAEPVRPVEPVPVVEPVQQIQPAQPQVQPIQSRVGAEYSQANAGGMESVNPMVQGNYQQAMGGNPMMQQSTGQRFMAQQSAMRQSGVARSAFSGGEMMMPVANGEGSRKKGKKWLIVVLVVMFIAAVGCGVAWWMMQGEGSEETDTPQMSETEKAFNRYANYLILGEKDSEAAIDLDVALEDYNIFNSLTIYGETVDFVELEEINKLYEEFVAKVDSEDDSESEEENEYPIGYDAQKYYYYYLGCGYKKISSDICKEKLGEDYLGYYGPFVDSEAEFYAVDALLGFRYNARNAIYEMWDVVYNVTEENE